MFSRTGVVRPQLDQYRYTTEGLAAFRGVLFFRFSPICSCSLIFCDGGWFRISYYKTLISPYQELTDRYALIASILVGSRVGAG